MQIMFGAGYLFGVRTDVANATPVSVGIMQDTSIDFSGDLKPLYGNGVFPVLLPRGKMKIEGKSKFARVNGLIVNNLFLGQAMASGQTLTSVAEAATVPASSPYTVTAANGATFKQDLGVFYTATGLPLTQVASGPTVGQYSVSNAGVYTFAAADTGAAVQLNYNYTATTGQTITITQQTLGATPAFKGIFTTSVFGKTMTLTLNNCASSKWNMPGKQDDTTINEMDFMAALDASGTLGTLSFSE